ncbi:MAG: DUF3488 and DUF4129 domain-containing transglutaminase family protein [Pseudomonadota bacterium]
MNQISNSALRWGLVSLLVAALPHTPRLPMWVTVLLFCSLSWRLVGAYRGWRLPARAIKWFAAITALVLVFFNFRTINGIVAGSALLVAMLALKVLETNNRRDLVALILSAYFLAIANLLYSQTIITLVYALLVLWVSTTALLQISVKREPLDAKHALRTGATLIMQAVPIMLLLFLLFPRIPTPLVGLSAGASARTGLGEEMSPGTITNLIQSDQIAFTVRFKDQAPRYGDLYWRGPVLHEFDGQSWTREGYVGPSRRTNIDTQGDPVSYTVTLEPNQRNWLFALDFPSERPRGSRLLWDFQLVSRYPIGQVHRYDVSSHLRHLLEPEIRPRLDASSPPGKNTRAVEYAQVERSKYATDEDYIDSVLQMFNQQTFSYTLQPPPLNMNTPVDDFLFNTKAGFCEHYASAFTVLMRAAGIPARVVTGYMGGDYNPITGHLTVRHSDAHAWSEVWLEGVGWRRVDPTAAVSPSRVQNGLADAVALGDQLPGAFFRNSAILLKLRYGYDAMNIWWNDFVLGYGPDAQKALLEKLGLKDYDWKLLVAILTAGMGLVMFALWFMLMRQIRPRTRDQLVSIYKRFCEKMAQLGITKLGHEGPKDFAARIRARRPDLGQDVTLITNTYVNLRYEANPRYELGDLRQLLRNFRPKKKP